MGEKTIENSPDKNIIHVTPPKKSNGTLGITTEKREDTLVETARDIIVQTTINREQKRRTSGKRG